MIFNLQNNNTFFLKLTVVSFFLIFPALSASAQQTAPPSNEPTTTIEAVTPRLQIDIPGVTFTSFKFKAGETVSIPFIMEYIQGIYKYLLGLAVFLAIIMVTVAGFRWMTSGGNASTIGEAKSQITGA